MFQTGEKIYQIDLFGVYASARAAMTADWPISPLRENQHGRRPSLLQSPTNWSKQDNNLMMKNIICSTSLETSNKKFSNWSIHKTVIGRLKKENLVRSGIGKITSDKNIESLDDSFPWQYQEITQHRNKLQQPVHPRQWVLAQNLMNTFSNCMQCRIQLQRHLPSHPAKKKVIPYNSEWFWLWQWFWQWFWQFFSKYKSHSETRTPRTVH